ncbi:MAG: 2-octaprenyl-6-methoxyphenyl hydroxylase [Methylococcaceae bacterium]|nr:2-octaprenyl-6-methoxyphenyl hydroxylase [Methylococcaceae bacterium]
MSTDFDILIVGGGLVGGSLALALRHSTLRIGLVEAVTDAERQASSASERALALSRSTVQILDGLGVWTAVAAKATPIQHIHVSDRGHFGKTRLHAADQGVDALGHVAIARALEDAIQTHLDGTPITRLCPARVMGLKAGPDSVLVSLRHHDENVNVSARLLVAADGGNSTVRSLLGIEQDVRVYGQTAIVTEVNTGKDTRFTAYERFTPSGPLAFLPLGRRKCSVVWTLKDPDAEDLLQQGTREFTASLQNAFGYWLGPITLGSRPQGFRLKLIRAEKMTDDRVVLIGNAMHQLHPVAGQGFNLGLRDAAMLSERILAQAGFDEDIGDGAFLSRYAEARRRDLGRVIRFTDTLVRVFSNDFPPLVVARNLALVTLDRLPFAKQLLAHQAMGYGNRL